MVNKLKEARKLLKKQDKEWSIMIRKRDKKCLVCGRTDILHAHHIVPRERKKLRHSLLNGVALCPRHHKYSYIISAHKNSALFMGLFQCKREKQYLRLCTEYDIFYGDIKKEINKEKEVLNGIKR